jgi:signal transduction histidine kinase
VRRADTSVERTRRGVFAPLVRSEAAALGDARTARPLDFWEVALDLTAAVVVVWALLTRLPADRLPAYFVLLGLACVFSALRRPRPATSTLLVTVVCVVVGVVGMSPLAVAVIAQVCLFSVALRADRRRTFTVGAVVAVGLVAAFALSTPRPLTDTSALAALPWTGLVLGAGLALRANRDYVQALEERATATLAARESETTRRVADERVRIARDLHDAVAHSIAVVNVHAGAAERRLATDTDGARESLREVRRASREVLLELRDIVAVLRTGDDDPVGPPASAEGVPALLAGTEALGLPVHAVIDAHLDGLDPTADAALYRVLQEALTNAHRHGTGAARVLVHDADDGILLVVTNPAADRVTGTEGGYGLVGMRERVEQAGGHLRTGLTSGVFAVEAWLPRVRHPARVEADAAGSPP